MPLVRGSIEKRHKKERKTMFPLFDIPDQSFESLEKLRDAIASQDRKVYEVPIRKVSLSEDGVFCAGRFEGRLAEPALCGLLNTEGIPLDFGLHRCPKDLLVTMVGRLAREQNISVVIQSIDGVATGIMPADRQRIRHDMLIDRLGVTRPIKEATLSAHCLRITATISRAEELLPSDTFGFGWELINRENGWRSTEAWRWIVREICTNGAVGFDKAPVFNRSYNSRKPVLISLQELLYVVENEMQPPVLKPALRWAANNRIAGEDKLVVNYLARKLQGDATRTELKDIGVSTTWYDLMNTLTSMVRLHSLETRRRYEADGGMLLNSFSHQGRGKPPWRRVSCDECEDWNAGETGGQDTSAETEG
jgi:hypothetical protein